MIREIIEEAEKFYDVAKGAVYDRCRTNSVADARHVAVYLSRKLTRHSISEIADTFHRHHTTIINSIRRVEQNQRRYRLALDKIKQVVSIVQWT